MAGKYKNRYVVTAPVASETTGDVDAGSRSLAGIFVTKRRRRDVEAPRTNDEGYRPNKIDKLDTRAPHTSYDGLPLRLRGGGDTDDSTFMSEDDRSCIRVDETPVTSTRKRKAGDSPPGQVPSNIAADMSAITEHIKDCKVFMKEMHSTTKVGIKWINGIEGFLSKILTSSTNIAMEAAVLSGRYEEARIESANQKKNFEEILTRTHLDRTYARVVGPSTEAAPIRETDENFPAAVTAQRSKVRKTPQVKERDKLEKAKKRPVKPVFIGVDNEVTIDEIWDALRRDTPKPRIDTCKTTSAGLVLLTSSDASTISALRTINSMVTESAPRKPRIKLKGISKQYENNFVRDSLLGQNPALENFSEQDVKPLFRCGPMNLDTSDWVIEVSPGIHKAIIGKRVYIGMVSTFPSTFINPPNCSRCLKLDHNSESTRDEDGNCPRLCLHCAKPGHQKSDCPNREMPPTCAQCGGQHKSLSTSCPTWSRRVRALQMRTKYDV